MMTVVWMLAIIAGIGALVTLISAAVAAVRGGAVAPAIVSVVMAMVFGTVAFRTFNPFVILVTGVVASVVAVIFVRSATRNKAEAGSAIKLSAAHCTLAAGSLLFLVPFAWLISTSLKPDDEQAVFPPVWIPTQQITTDKLKGEDGEDAKLSWFQKGAQKVQVAEIAELPSGLVKVQPLQALSVSGNKPFDVTREELTKIREKSPRWGNYSDALKFLPADTIYGLRFLLNTLFLTLMTTIGTLIASSMVAYSFARLKWPGKNLCFIILLATMMIPGAVTMMPQFLIYRTLGWVDTLLPLWVPAFFGSAFSIFLLRQFFMAIPTELEDAAKIDGCGPFSTYWRVMLPQVKPALAAISIMSIMGAWNNFQGPLIYLSSQEKMPLAYALQLYQQQHGGEPGLLMAASTLVVLPIIVLFFFTQRYFIEGVSLSGLGGR